MIISIEVFFSVGSVCIYITISAKINNPGKQKEEIIDS